MSNEPTHTTHDYHGGSDVEMGKRGDRVTCEGRLILAAFPVEDGMLISDGEYLWFIEQEAYYNGINRFLSA